MRIAITGCAGSKHKDIAKMLAERLTLQLITADMFIEESTALYGEGTVECDVRTNIRIVEEILKSDDYVLDSLISFTIPNTIRIYIDRDLTEEVMYPTSLLESMERDIEFTQKYCSGIEPDIYINRTTMSDLDVVQLIIDLLISGETGVYVPINMCVPHVELLDDCIVNFNELNAAHVDVYNNVYIITQAILGCTLHSKKFIKVIKHDVDNAVLKHPSVYIHWFDLLDNKDVLMLNIMLNRYCSEGANLLEVYSEYVKLMHNGNALSKLIELEGGC